MFEIFKEFRFDAAHTLSKESDPRYGRVHGHSFVALVFIRGRKDAAGWVLDLGVLDSRVKALREKLDHQYLNEVATLGTPTMENIAEYIWREMSSFPGLYKVIVRRDSLGEGCSYFGPGSKDRDSE